MQTHPLDTLTVRARQAARMNPNRVSAFSPHACIEWGSGVSYGEARSRANRARLDDPANRPDQFEYIIKHPAPGERPRVTGIQVVEPALPIVGREAAYYRSATFAEVRCTVVTRHGTIEERDGRMKPLAQRATARFAAMARRFWAQFPGYCLSDAAGGHALNSDAFFTAAAVAYGLHYRVESAPQQPTPAPFPHWWVAARFDTPLPLVTPIGIALQVTDLHLRSDSTPKTPNIVLVPHAPFSVAITSGATAVLQKSKTVGAVTSTPTTLKAALAEPITRRIKGVDTTLEAGMLVTLHQHSRGYRLEPHLRSLG